MDPQWDQDAQQKFQELLAKIPVFMRPIAESKVSQKARQLAVADQRTLITQKDMVDAFFSETPFGFHGPMKSDMLSIGIDYTQYGHDR